MNKILFDTSSLIVFVKYYLPFDKKGELQNFLCNGFNKKEFLLLQEVEKECKCVSQGLVFEKFLKPTNTKVTSFNDVPDIKIHREIDNNLVASRKKNRLTLEEYEIQKSIFMNSADFKLIYYAIQNPQCTIITEESLAENDNKLFKKIPKICEIKRIRCLNLTNFIQENLELSFSVSYKNRLQI